MKILSLFGTRPELIRLSRILPLLDRQCRHVTVHTGQNFTASLRDLFFQELELRPPDHDLACRADTPMGLVGQILEATERILLQEKPDRVLILGDTNSAMGAIAAKRMGIPVFHMEAGNRCFDDRVPEEVNRRLLDHCSDVLLPYTERSREHLLREGIPSDRILVTGNPIREVLEFYAPRIEASRILHTLGLSQSCYFLVTLHRAENVDVPSRLASFLEAFTLLASIYRLPIVCSLHPRMRSQLEKQGKTLDIPGFRALEPMGLFDFVKLEQNALAVLSDSGTVQEECCLFHVPTVTLRDVTERPETLEAGSNLLAGADSQSIVDCVRLALELPRNWTPPREYLTQDVSATVARILLGYRRP